LKYLLSLIKPILNYVILLGEAKFLRAFMYFTLVRSFGGVPLVDHVPVTGVEADKAMALTRRTKEEIYAFIEKDLKEA
jgi:hypothetical protein